MRLKEIYRPIAKELSELENVLARAFAKSGKVPSKVSRFAVCAPGKRLRPALVFLAAKVGGKKNKKTVDLAAAIEIIHTATLIHDDLIDSSRLRRGQMSVAAKWGGAMAILAGDFLFSRAFELIIGLGEPKITHSLLETARTMCEGEMAGHASLKKSTLNKKGYLDLIAKKTAALFAAGCESGALLGRASTAETGALRAYGHDFGMAFQLIDDYLDFAGARNETGRVLGKAGLKNEAAKYARFAKFSLKKIRSLKVRSSLEELLDLILVRAE